MAGLYLRLPVVGCELTGGCSASAIGDHMCSVGSGLQCFCQHPRLTGDGSTCPDGMYTPAYTLHTLYLQLACLLSVIHVRVSTMYLHHTILSVCFAHQ